MLTPNYGPEEEVTGSETLRARPPYFVYVEGARGRSTLEAGGGRGGKAGGEGEAGVRGRREGRGGGKGGGEGKEGVRERGEGYEVGKGRRGG